MEKFFDFLKNKNQIHFIGIGGSGMYPLAQILRSKGYNLTGSDNNETDTLDAVRKMGITVYLGHSANNINDADLIVYSAAIKKDNPELVAAAKNNIPAVERSKLLGLVTSWYKKAVCVSGTHGKTTVSSMLTHIFLAENIDVSAVIGGKLKAINGSGKAGTSDIMVCEACEFADTFLQLSPDISVILNIDRDHLDYFGTMDNLRLSFTKFCNLTSSVLVINGDDENTRIAAGNSDFAGKTVTFGFGANNGYYPVNISGTEFDLYRKGEFLTHISLKIYGVHNILNAVAACAAAIEAGCGPESASIGLSSFEGAGRRFERLAVIDGVTVADDYAHHPAEITVTLKTAKNLGFKRVWAVHQPFTYSRTAALLNEFADALSIADKVTLTEIMGGREKNDYNVCSKDLADKLGDCKVIADYDNVARFVSENVETDDLIITLGCGDVNKIAHKIVKNLQKRHEK